MKATIRLTLVLVFLMHFATNIFGQSASVAIGKDRRAWFGVNWGGVWQKSDVRPRLGSGSGFTFDYYLTRNTTSTFGLGFRAQYLKATSYGLGLTRDFQIQDNTSLNGISGSPNYASLAAPNNYVFQNHSTDIKDLSGNVIISLNRLRAVSRIHLYVFGGFGGTGYITTMDQLAANQNIYDYTNVDVGFSNSFTKRDLKELRDGTYETYAESGSKRKWTVTPTIGAGFGIQLSSRVQLGLEHKVGYTGTDLLDGNKWGSNTKNDTYRYSSLTISIGMGNSFGENAPRSRRVYTTPSNPVVSRPTVRPPVIRIVSPSTSPVTLEHCVASVEATVENISNSQNIRVTQNGQPIDFEFSSNTIIITDLNFQGTADFRITATNTAGTDTRTVSFICKPEAQVEMITICHLVRGAAPTTLNIPISDWPVHSAHGDTRGACPIVLPPVVTITSPVSSPVTLENCVASVTASIENISNRQGIRVTQNGTPINFGFNGNIVTVSNISFTGTANFTVTASNSAGSSFKTVSFVCQPPVAMITICHSISGGAPQTINIPQTEWAAHAAHGDNQGACPVILPPTLTITSPTSSPVTLENCVASVAATVEHVSNRNGIAVTQNGTPVNFGFSGNTINISNISFTGTANFKITATNVSGSAVQTVTFICQPPVEMITICHYPPGNRDNPQGITIPESAWPAHEAHGDTKGACPVIQPPVVDITSPTAASVTVEDCHASVQASVQNVEEKHNISVSENGKTIPFDFSAGVVRISNISFTGTTTFVITATNSVGSSNKTVTFICNPKEVELQICHYPPGNRDNPQGITIPESAWPAHEAHGDTRGACPDKQPPIDKEKEEKERIEKEKAEKEKADKEREEKEKADKEKAERELAEKEKAEGELAEKARIEKEKAAKELAEKEKAEKEKADKEREEKEKAEKEKEDAEQITICHHPPGNSQNFQTITISKSAWEAHEKHGDTKGPCKD